MLGIVCGAPHDVQVSSGRLRDRMVHVLLLGLSKHSHCF